MAKLKIGEDNYAVGLVVKEANRHRFYDHELSDIANLGAVTPQSGVTSFADVGRSGQHRGHAIKILRKNSLRQ